MLDYREKRNAYLNTFKYHNSVVTGQYVYIMKAWQADELS